MKRALVALLQFAVVIHAETSVSTAPDDLLKTAAATAIRIEKPDGSHVASGVLVTPDG